MEIIYIFVVMPSYQIYNESPTEFLNPYPVNHEHLVTGPLKTVMNNGGPCH